MIRGGNQWGGRRSDFPPLTTGLVALNVVSFLAGFFLKGSIANPAVWLALSSSSFPILPWTLATWAVVPGTDLFGIIFGALWLWWIGSSLERSWGTRQFGLFLLATTVASGLAVWLAATFVFRIPFILLGLTVATAAPTLAWCWLNRHQTVVFSFLFPIPALWLGWITLAFAWYSVGAMNGQPFLGIFALAGPALAWFWVRRGVGRVRWAPRKGSNLRFEDFDRTPGGGRENPQGNWWDRLKRRSRDKRLERMFRNSGFDRDKD